YVLCGIINMLVSLITGRESAALFFSLLAGISLGLANMAVTLNSGESQMIRCVILAVSAASVYVFCIAVANKKDFSGKKSA
ncbi:MAG: hypothetical protein K2K44_05695, partial [Oscillospiraceae bacterium]|nr:hypothetical protein [Oscillospiraceae bacterium]